VTKAGWLPLWPPLSSGGNGCLGLMALAARGSGYPGLDPERQEETFGSLGQVWKGDVHSEKHR
jgi:hypothetical protein